jgi:photosystem II stability/assembly factor-like uncharacterized protein
MTIYAAGDNPYYYYTKSVIQASDDQGETWRTVCEPMQTHEGIRGAAVNDQTWLLLSNAGSAVTSADGVTWGASYAFEQPLRHMFACVALPDLQGFLAVGWQKSPVTLAEQAVITFTNQGTDAQSWQARYLNPNPNSALMSCWISPDATTCIAVGYEDQNKPLLVYSLDQGQSWNKAQLPSDWQGALYAITGTAAVLRLGGQGQVFTMQFDQGVVTPLKVSSVLKDAKNRARSITWLASDWDQSTSVKVLALSGSNIWFSINGVDYDHVTMPGYTFVSGLQVGNRFMLSCHSLLNQYTGFWLTITDNPDPQVHLEGYHNGVHAYQLWQR